MDCVYYSHVYCPFRRKKCQDFVDDEDTGIDRSIDGGQLLSVLSLLPTLPTSATTETEIVLSLIVADERGKIGKKAAIHNRTER